MTSNGTGSRRVRSRRGSGIGNRNGEGSRFREPSLKLACKPDSVVSSHPSERPTWTSAGNLRAVLLGLASSGVYLAAVSPRRRCALTAPFHPYLCAPHVLTRHRRCISVALSRGFPRVGFPTTLPCDVRTFLEGDTSAAAWPAM